MSVNEKGSQFIRFVHTLFLLLCKDCLRKEDKHRDTVAVSSRAGAVIVSEIMKSAAAALAISPVCTCEGKSHASAEALHASGSIDAAIAAEACGAPQAGNSCNRNWETSLCPVAGCSEGNISETMLQHAKQRRRSALPPTVVIPNLTTLDNPMYNNLANF